MKIRKKEEKRKNGGQKTRFPRLSIKILLTLFAVLLVVYIVMFTLLSIARAAGFQPPEDRESINVWLNFMVYVFPPVLGVSIIALFACALNYTVVARICRLEAATDEVAKGNFDISVGVRGKDELSSLAASFNRMSAELKQNEYLSKEFIRNVSHEFKTPISAIRAYGELVDAEADGGIDKTALKEYAHIIMKESDRLTLMIKSILQLSLLDSTTITKKDDAFNPAEQIRDIFRLTQAQWSEKDITLDLNLEEITITNNEQLLYHVWQNLISNAIKFSRGGGVITAVLKRGGDGVLFEIADNGVGIKDGDKAKIFNHFFMADASRNTAGSGLGLAVVKKILSNIGGEISFESAEGKGTIFRVRL